MPKMKSNRAARKRMKLTSKGKVKKACAFTGHLKACKSRKTKRNLRKGGILSKADTKNMKLMLA